MVDLVTPCHCVCSVTSISYSRGFFPTWDACVLSPDPYYYLARFSWNEYVTPVAMPSDAFSGTYAHKAIFFYFSGMPSADTRTVVDWAIHFCDSF